MPITYFIADLHLSEHDSHITQLFVDFIQQKAIHADNVYILGDLFDFWIGDDDPSPIATEVKKQIKQLTSTGVPCYFIQGNRDFLLGQKFAQACNLTLLPANYLIDLYGIKTLICHGDLFCTDDVSYQKFRKKVHQRWRQKLFLLLPLKIRLKIAQNIRSKSNMDKHAKSGYIMDVNPDSILNAFHHYAVKQIIHGHTHQQAIHETQDNLRRIVLGDWGKSASILEVDAQGIRFINL